MRDDPRPDDDLVQPGEPKKSKTRRKKEMIELQKLGERLVKLPDGYLKGAGIPDELLDAIRAARRITSFGARRRQMQYIGAIMRGVDPAHIMSVLDDFGRQSATGNDPEGRKR